MQMDISDTIIALAASHLGRLSWEDASHTLLYVSLDVRARCYVELSGGGCRSFGYASVEEFIFRRGWNLWHRSSPDLAGGPVYHDWTEKLPEFDNVINHDSCWRESLRTKSHEVLMDAHRVIHDQMREAACGAQTPAPRDLDQSGRIHYLYLLKGEVKKNYGAARSEYVIQNITERIKLETF